MPERESTFNQRKAILNMRQGLGYDLKGLHDLTFAQASAEIDKLIKEIEEKDFPQNEDEESLI